MDRGRHQFGCFGRGETEHDTLIASAFVLVACRIHTLRNMRGLFVQQVGDFTCRVVKLVLLIADVFDAGAGNIFDLAHVFA